MRKFFACLLFTNIFAQNPENPGAKSEFYRLKKTLFDSKSDITLSVESKRYPPRDKFHLVQKEMGKEIITLAFIPDTVLEVPGAEWQKGPTFRLGKLKPGIYRISISEYPKCHRDPHPCTGAMWISPFLNSQITVK
jgi:hypothetical protein